MNIIDEVNKIKTSNSNLKEYQSKPIMTKYELNSIISLRTTHLANMAIPFVELPNNFKIENNMDLRKIVLMELKQGVLPYLVSAAFTDYSSFVPGAFHRDFRFVLFFFFFFFFVVVVVVL